MNIVFEYYIIIAIIFGGLYGMGVVFHVAQNEHRLQIYNKQIIHFYLFRGIIGIMIWVLSSVIAASCMPLLILEYIVRRIKKYG